MSSDVSGDPGADAAFTPLHERVKRQVSEEILMGRWAPGAVLPGEVALAERFGVSVGTVRRALADLVAEGLLTRRPRAGRMAAREGSTPVTIASSSRTSVPAHRPVRAARVGETSPRPRAVDEEEPG